MSSKSISWDAENDMSGYTSDKRWTYGNSNWASQLDAIPPYAKITNVNVHLRYRSSVSADWDFGIVPEGTSSGGTRIAHGTSGSASKETDVNITKYVITEGENSGQVDGDILFRGYGIYCKYQLGHITVTWDYDTPVFVVTLSQTGEGTVSGAGTYDVGTNATITAIPANGYYFVKWSDGDTQSSRTITISNGNQKAYSTSLNYTAIFEKVKYTLTVTAGTGGTVTGSGTYEYGTSVTIKATPSSGYRFVKWSDGNTSAARTITVTGNATYTAEFATASAYVTYDSIFSLLSWRKYGITGSNATVSNISSTGFTLTSNAGIAEGTATSHYFPIEAGKSYKIDIDITGDNWDVYIFFCDESGSWIDFSDSKNRFSSNGGGVSSRVFTAPSGSVKAQIRVDANNASNTVSYSNFRIYPADCEYMSNSVAASERTDIGSWSMPTPTRSGYTFVGWNSKPDGSGETYSSSSVFPLEDMSLYSQWKLGEIYVGIAQPQIYIGTQLVKSVYMGTTKKLG